MIGNRKKHVLTKDKAKHLMKGRMANYFSGSLTSSATSKLEMSSSPCSVSSHKRRRTGLLTKSKKPTLKHSLEALEDCNPIQHIQRLQQCWGKKTFDDVFRRAKRNWRKATTLPHTMLLKRIHRS